MQWKDLIGKTISKVEVSRDDDYVSPWVKDARVTFTDQSVTYFISESSGSDECGCLKIDDSPADDSEFRVPGLNMRSAATSSEVKCPKSGGIGAPWNNSASVPCSVCNGSGKIPELHRLVFPEKCPQCGYGEILKLADGSWTCRVGGCEMTGWPVQSQGSRIPEASTESVNGGSKEKAMKVD